MSLLRLGLSWCLLSACAPGPQTGAPARPALTLDDALRGLAGEMSQSALLASHRPRLVVQPFLDRDGQAVELGQYLAERLIGALLGADADGGEFEVLDRVRANARQPDAQIVGNITRLGDSVEVNCRLVDLDSGRVLATARALLPADAVASLLHAPKTPVRETSDPRATPVCPATFAELSPELRQRGTTCDCREVPSQGSVWGSDVYTQDSSLCRAAMHAGLVGRQGGSVEVQAFQGCPRYVASERNGVGTAAWGAYGASFFFPAAQAARPQCAQAQTQQIAENPQQQRSGVCPSSLASAPERQGDFACVCPALFVDGGVWGSRIYTTDSVLCKAAVHAGALPAGSGGRVKVKTAPGCPAYTGTPQNGVTTSSWGAYGASFYFEGFGDGRCR